MQDLTPVCGRDGSMQTVESSQLEAQTAEALRLSQFRRVDVVLAG
ncbi:MAG: hypothetical protein WAW41_14170 [Methylobacter sp.]